MNSREASFVFWVGPAKVVDPVNDTGPAIAKTSGDTYREQDPDRDPVPKPTKPV